MYVPNLIRTQEMERFGFFFYFWCRLDLHNRSRHYPVWFFVTNRTRPIDHVNLVSFLALIALVWSITLLFCLVFVTDHTRSDRLEQFSFVFGINNICTINHVDVIFFSLTVNTQSDQSWQFSLIFDIGRSYTISHVVVLYCFCHGSHLIWLIMITEFHFWRRLYLYDRSHYCPIRFSSSTAPGPIDHNNLVSFSA